MDDLHAPTVPSGPTHHATTNGKHKQTLPQLIARKENLEAELSALGSVLDSHGVNMSTSLTTFDGYPRADIDVAQIRTTRARIIHLKTDHKALMKELEDAVHEQFAAKQPATVLPSRNNNTRAPVAAPASAPATVEAPFAKVNTVVDGSPADEAGLKPGDRIIRFGYVNWTNHERLSKVAQVVQQNEHRQINVRILRDASTLEVHLTPRQNWGGRGMLGCHLLPI